MASRAFKNRLTSSILKRFAKYYFRKERPYSYKKIKGVILPAVFHPYFTISTKLLLTFVDQLDLKGKSFLELGCGTGMISTLAAQKGAQVTATDVNPKAIENVELNAKKNGVTVKTIFSDLFSLIPEQIFDFIVINPPYYPKKPLNDEERAWFCGEEFEYFQQLFSTIKSYFNQQSEVYMILSEDCELETIQQLATKNSIEFETVLKKRKRGEWNYIFRLKNTHTN